MGSTSIIEENQFNSKEKTFFKVFAFDFNLKKIKQI